LSRISDSHSNLHIYGPPVWADRRRAGTRRRSCIRQRRLDQSYGDRWQRRRQRREILQIEAVQPPSAQLVAHFIHRFFSFLSILFVSFGHIFFHKRVAVLFTGTLNLLSLRDCHERSIECVSCVIGAVNCPTTRLCCKIK
jgi:hypothetical protein